MSANDPRDIIFYPSSDESGEAGWDGIAQLRRDISITGGLAHMQMKDVTGETRFWVGYTLIPPDLLTYEFAQRQSTPSGKSPFQHMKLVGLDPEDKRVLQVDSPEDVIVLLAKNAQPAFWMGEAPTKETMVRKQMVWHERKREDFEALAREAVLRRTHEPSNWPDERLWQGLFAAAEQLSEDTPFVPVQGPRLIGSPLVWAGYSVIPSHMMLVEFGQRIVNPQRRTPLRDQTLMSINPYERRASVVQSADDFVDALAHESIFSVYSPGPLPTKRSMHEAQMIQMLGILFEIGRTIAELEAEEEPSKSR